MKKAPMASVSDKQGGEKPKLRVILCSPRGFCAGVVRAIDLVERALALYGPPVYVRHEIVHNRYVVDSLRAKGAIFVEELDEIPDTGAPVVFSAHGVPKSVPDDARLRNFLTLDATCPLVTKVHREAEIHFRRGREILLIGHAGHPEVIGTLGQLPEGSVALIELLADARTFVPKNRTTSLTSRRPRSRSTTPQASWMPSKRGSPRSLVRKGKTSATPPPTGRKP